MRDCILGTVVISLLSLTISLKTLFFPAQVKMVAFDLKGTVQTFIAQSSHIKLSAFQQQQLSVRFDQALNQSLTRYAHDHHVVVMVKQAVVQGIPDITPMVKKQIATLMQKGVNS